MGASASKRVQITAQVLSISFEKSSIVKAESTFRIEVRKKGGRIVSSTAPKTVKFVDNGSCIYDFQGETLQFESTLKYDSTRSQPLVSAQLYIFIMQTDTYILRLVPNLYY